jgi:3-oxoacyl-[acyl-carrier protein] reductase
MDLGLNGKTALVTGASKGLGRHAALALAKEGCNVAICARGAADLTQTTAEIKELGVKAFGIQADVTDKEDLVRIYHDTVRELGPIDILVNNAGGSRGGKFDSSDEEVWEYILQLNLLSAIRLTRLCLSSMKERQWGRIINIASIWGREHGGALSYMASKSALIAFSKHLALEIASNGITVNAIAPGSILFPGSGWERFQESKPPEVVKEFIKNNLPMGQFGWPEPVGSLVAYLASNQADLMTGTCINIDGGQSKSLI